MEDKLEEQQTAAPEPAEKPFPEGEMETPPVLSVDTDAVSENDEALAEIPVQGALTDAEGFREAVRKSAQSMKDKELAPVYTELKNARQELTKLRVRLTEKQQSAELDRKEQAEQQVWGEIPEVGRFQDERRELLRERQSLVQDKIASERVADGLQAVAKRQEAVELAMQHLLPGGEEAVSRLGEFVSALMEAETPREMALLAQVKGSELKAEADQKRDKKQKIDSSVHSAGGGLSVDKLSPSEKIAVGLEQAKRKSPRRVT